jgi:hypothetical protein
MTQVFLTIGFVLSLSVLTLAASFADVPPQVTITARR